MRLRHEAREEGSEGISLGSSETEGSSVSSYSSEVRDPHASSSNQPIPGDSHEGIERGGSGSAGASEEGTGGDSSRRLGFQYLAPVVTPVVRIRRSCKIV